jgi:hypothetical protein
MIGRHAGQLLEAVADLGPEVLVEPIEDVVSRLKATYELSVPRLERDRMVLVSTGEAPIQGSPLRKQHRLMFAVPFEGQPGLFGVRPSTHRLVQFDGKVVGQELHLELFDATGDADIVRKRLDASVEDYELELRMLRSDVAAFNANLEGHIRQLVTERRDALLRGQNLVAALGVPIRRREDAVIPIRVQRVRPVFRPQPGTNERFEPEPELELAVYEDILAAMRSMGIVMEKSPGTFSALMEEGIRDFYLAVLNLSFVGQAKGEVFNAGGRTDILITWDERNIFIAEFKIWSGSNDLATAVDQLLGYMTWRDTKCAIVIIVRERGVSEIVEKAHNTLTQHRNHKRTVNGTAELQRRYVFHQRGDLRRELLLTLLVFPVPNMRAGRSRRRHPQ